MNVPRLVGRHPVRDCLGLAHVQGLPGRPASFCLGSVARLFGVRHRSPVEGVSESHAAWCGQGLTDRGVRDKFGWCVISLDRLCDRGRSGKLFPSVRVEYRGDRRVWGTADTPSIPWVVRIGTRTPTHEYGACGGSVLERTRP